MSSTPTKILMDVDTGVDDALALMLALRSPELEMIGCTTVAGNVSVEETTRNTLAVLELAGRADIPVSRGAARPLVRRLTTATYFHGPHGMGQLELPEPTAKPVVPLAPKFLIDMAERYPGELTVIAVGPLTNLAMALLLDPHFGRKLKRLIIMGGAVRTPGNITPVAEANFYNDPEAAQAVMNSGAAITLVGLDVTNLALLRWREIAHLEAQRESLSPIAAASLELLRYYSRVYGVDNGARLHDPLAVGVAIRPELVQTERMQVDVETQGKFTRGQSVGYNQMAVDLVENKGEYDDAIGIRLEHPSNAEVCLQLDVPGFIKMFRERLGLE